MSSAKKSDQSRGAFPKERCWGGGVYMCVTGGGADPGRVFN